MRCGDHVNRSLPDGGFRVNSPENPGPSRWAWASLNYLRAQLIATQMHYAAGFLPSYRPLLQFTTRYSGLLWARDLRVVADEEKILDIVTPEDVVCGKLVYRRERAGGVRSDPSFSADSTHRTIPLYRLEEIQGAREYQGKGFFPCQEIVEGSSEPGVVGYLKLLPKEKSVLGNDGPGEGP